MAKKTAFSLSDSNSIGYEIKSRKTNGDDYQFTGTDNEDMIVGDFDYQSCPEMNMQIATTGHYGGDIGHGGRTTIDITLGSTFGGDMIVTHEKGKYRPHLHFSMGGDMELDQIADAFFNAAIFLHKAARDADEYIEDIDNGIEPNVSI